MYFPVMGMMKGKIVPESCRSTLYNFFRVPLNLIVVLCLLFDIPVRFGFLMTAAMLGSCVYLLRKIDSDAIEGNSKKEALSGEATELKHTSKSALQQGSASETDEMKQVIGMDLDEGDELTARPE